MAGSAAPALSAEVGVGGEGGSALGADVAPRPWVDLAWLDHCAVGKLKTCIGLWWHREYGSDSLIDPHALR